MTDPSTVVVPVELSKIISPNPADTTNAQKKKTRLVYCSDGVVEVTDESEPESNSDTDEDTDGGDAQNTPDGSGVDGFSRESNGGGSGSTGGSNGVGSSRGSSGGGSARSSTRSSRSSGRSARFATYPARTSCQPEWIVATNPRALRWSTWFWYYTVFAGCKTLDAADWAGEQLAWFFGITTPKVSLLLYSCMTFTSVMSSTQHPVISYPQPLGIGYTYYNPSFINCKYSNYRTWYTRTHVLLLCNVMAVRGCDRRVRAPTRIDSRAAPPGAPRGSPAEGAHERAPSRTRGC